MTDSATPWARSTTCSASSRWRWSGFGGLGSPIAEQLVRMGAGSVTLVDHDVLDTPSNVRRVIGSAMSDLRATVAPPKVDVVGRHLDQLGLGSPVRRVRGDVRSGPVFRQILDADVVICATDNHASRAVINELASAYLLPVIDVGVQAGAKKNAGLAALVAEICVLTPVTPCLWCRRRISADIIRAEKLPAGQCDKLVREGYLAGGVGTPAPSVMALTAATQDGRTQLKRGETRCDMIGCARSCDQRHSESADAGGRNADHARRPMKKRRVTGHSDDSG